MILDPEIRAMSEVLEIFKGIEHGPRKRIMEWITARFHLVEEVPPAAAEQAQPAVDAIEQPVAPQPVQETTPGFAVPTPPPAPPKDDLKSYKTLADLLKVSAAKRVIDRILVAAAYLQETKDADEITSYEINSQLKKAGGGIPNISIGLNRLLEKVPQVLTATRSGDTKQSRRRFTVTEEGISVAKRFLK